MRAVSKVKSLPGSPPRSPPRTTTMVGATPNTPYDELHDDDDVQDYDNLDKDETDTIKALSPTGTEQTDGSDEGGGYFFGGSGSNELCCEKYGKCCALVSLVLVLAVSATLLGLFVAGNNGNRASNQLGAVENGNGGLFGNIGREPTPIPTEQPTTTPSSNPSSIPSLAPSTRPSALPSISPSVSPSSQPSFRPSNRPSTSPSVSPTSMPTRERVPEDFDFRLKLYWERWFFWQEEPDERRWCAECTTCVQLTTSGNGEGCRDEDGRDRRDCNRGDLLWLMRCDGWDGGSGNAKFELIREHPIADQIKIKGKDLCLERASNRHLDLQRCDPEEQRQLFVGIRLDGEPFELRPYQQNWRPNMYDQPYELELCVSQHHHPKAGEVLYLEDCHLAQFWNTILWEFY